MAFFFCEIESRVLEAFSLGCWCGCCFGTLFGVAVGGAGAGAGAFLRGERTCALGCLLRTSGVPFEVLVWNHPPVFGVFFFHSQVAPFEKAPRATDSWTHGQTKVLIGTIQHDWSMV